MKGFPLLLAVGLFVDLSLFASEARLDCVYSPRATASTPEPELSSFAGCGRERDDGSAELEAAVLAALDFGDEGLAWIRLGEHFYYVRPDGRSARVPTYDNGPDDFAEGLVRTVRTGDGVAKIGYVDRELEVVIAARYDWGFPFEGGRARVCIGCRAGTPDGDGHNSVSGGLWGYIDKSGKEIVPVMSSLEDLDSR